MSSIVPPARPQMDADSVEAILRAKGMTDVVCLVGVRGYYLNSMGERGKNDRGMYDDALFLRVGGSVKSYNFNTDPSAYRDGIATLCPGIWKYKLGIHGLSKPKAQQYEALVQAGKVEVSRDGKGKESGWFGINIHRGGAMGTSSLGCQTIPPGQWPDFIGAVRTALKNHGQTVLPYLLITEAERAALVG